ncbi:unnamed protein product [Spirodela intermedia]|uniref:Uncharacterized protein n=1 Tax=Spirodela intermedia TaxID=51605 RepID=A0A7I8K3D8_SPIIN|nr:unnamed protein product [Spirodela intermedia]
MIPHSYAMHSLDRAQDLAAGILSASSASQIVAACSAVEEFLRGHPGNQARPFFSIAFPALICRLFGFDGSSPCSSRSPSPSSAWVDQADPDVAARVFGLLSPTGILFSSISAVDRQCPVRFVFPVERLPEWMRFMLQSEKHCSTLPNLCPLFRSRVKEDSVQGSFQIQLNVFEYFMFWFAYYPVCRGKSENSDSLAVRKCRRFKLENWTGSWPSLSSSSCLSRQKKGCGLYMKLLYAYLRVFVPKHGLSTCQPYRSSLFHCSSIYDDSVLLQAEFVVYTLVHFWMVDNDFSPLPLSLCSSFSVSFPFQTLLAETPPTSSLGQVLQLLVTYLNSSLGDPLFGGHQVEHDVGSGLNISQSGDMGKTKTLVVSSDNLVDSWNSVIQRPLYRFILRSLMFCPIETTMQNASQVFSLWTSYMEPWEITSDVFLEFEMPEGEKRDKLGKDKAQFQDHYDVSGRLRSEKGYSLAWQGYVTSNYLFYNSLFVHFLGFAHKFLHTNVEKIVLMVLKVLNVMTSSKELMSLLKKVDAAYHFKPTGASPALPDSGLLKLIPAIRQQLQDWENGLCESDVDGSFLHENWNRDLRLFSDDEDGAHWLLQLFILRAESEIQSLPRDNLAQSLHNLDAVRTKMGILFDGPIRRAPQSTTAKLTSSRASHAEGFSPKYPGIGKSRWAEVKYRGDWMRRPISDSEVAWLAVLLVNLSAWLNSALGLDQASGHVPAVPTYIDVPPHDLGAASGPVEAMRMLLAFLGSWLGSLGFSLVHHLRKRGTRVNLRPLASKKLVLMLLVFALAAMLRRTLSKP